ncbi:MAG TPA: M15 family metallopeptidase [Candidatus Limnocylindria bacterium]|nr:M15 family metallopeptidase [Candidatus Limnocylindria bacterium]
MRFSQKILALFILLAILGVGVQVFRRSQSDKTGQSDSDPPGTAAKTFDKTKHSTNQAGSLWWVVNKKRPLPAGYAPSDLTTANIPVRTGGDESKVSKKVVPDLEALVTAAKKEKLNLLLVSGYRSYSLQVMVYDQNVRQLGQAEADKVSAKPGTSEHQTGLALDLGAASRTCELEECFGATPEGKWIAAHAHQYGFTIRYLKGKQAITGYNYEPWHLRFVGKELATELHRTNQTMEEFFAL